MTPSDYVKTYITIMLEIVSTLKVGQGARPSNKYSLRFQTLLSDFNIFFFDCRISILTAIYTQHLSFHDLMSVWAKDSSGCRRVEYTLASLKDYGSKKCTYDSLTMKYYTTHCFYKCYHKTDHAIPGCSRLRSPTRLDIMFGPWIAKAGHILSIATSSHRSKLADRVFEEVRLRSARSV